MGRTVIVVYRPKPGKNQQLLQLVKDHLPVLHAQKLITDRKPIVMRAADGAIIEVFEWRSADAIKSAHHNQAVQALWQKFNEVCDYEAPVNVKEFQGMFSEFETID